MGHYIQTVLANAPKGLVILGLLAVAFLMAELGLWLLKARFSIVGVIGRAIYSLVSSIFELCLEILKLLPGAAREFFSIVIDGIAVGFGKDPLIAILVIMFLILLPLQLLANILPAELQGQMTSLIEGLGAFWFGLLALVSVIKYADRSSSGSKQGGHDHH